VKLTVIAVGLIAILTMTACSGGGKSNPGPSPAASAAGSNASVASTQPAQAADPAPLLLSINDLPTGWSIDNSASDSAGGPKCLATLKDSFASTKKANASFVDGTSVPALVHAVGTYVDAAAASAAFDRGTGILDGCKDISFSSDGKKYSGSIGAMSFPTIGERSKAWALSLSNSGLNIGIDVVLFLKGAAIEEVALLDLGSPNTDDLKTFCDKSLAKLA
jgi:hypothetical protein